MHETLLAAADARDEGYLDTSKWTPKQLLLLEKATESQTLRSVSCDQFFETQLGRFVVWTGWGSVWVAVGVAFALLDQDMTGAESWEFAITSISTGGLMGPKVDADNHLGTFSALFCSFYCLVGVPLFGAWIGAWINLLLDQSQKEEGVKDALEILSAGIDDTVSEYYIHRIVPVLYPLISEGGMSTKADIEDRCQRIRDDNPPLMDALLIAGLEDGVFDLVHHYLRNSVIRAHAERSF